MRTIDTLVIHCSATKASMDIGAKEIRKWHTKPKSKGGPGWSDIGYHYVIRRDGSTEDGRPNQRAGAHAKGHNRTSIGICLVGGVDEQNNPETNFTIEQRKSLRALVNFLKQTYSIDDSQIFGHRDFPGVAKACPCFDVDRWLRTGRMRP